MQYTHERRERTEPVTINREPYPLVNPGLWSSMKDYLAGRNLDFYLAKHNGWYGSNHANDNAPRIVIPATSGIMAQNAKHKYWQARAMDHNPIRYQSPYGSRLDAVIIVYPVGGADGNKLDKALLVEGPMDALAGAAEGYYSIAMMGNTPSLVILEHIAALTKHCRVLLMSDSDAAGQSASIVTSLASLGVKIKMRVSSLGKDLASIAAGNRGALLKTSFRDWE